MAQGYNLNKAKCDQKLGPMWNKVLSSNRSNIDNCPATPFNHHSTWRKFVGTVFYNTVRQTTDFAKSTVPHRHILSPKNSGYDFILWTASRGTQPIMLTKNLIKRKKGLVSMRDCMTTNDYNWKCQAMMIRDYFTFSITGAQSKYSQDVSPHVKVASFWSHQNMRINHTGSLIFNDRNRLVKIDR